jgi:hypothetical protein
MSDSTRAPRDRTDLYLAPVALALDAWLDKWGDIPEQHLDERISLATNEEPRTAAERQQAVTNAIAHEVQLHGWLVDLVPRGVRLHHGPNDLVLGLPENLKRYVSGPPV